MAVGHSLTQHNFQANVHQPETAMLPDLGAGAMLPRRYGWEERGRYVLLVEDLIRLITMSIVIMPTCSSLMRFGHVGTAPRRSAHKRHGNLTPFLSWMPRPWGGR
jgi:hypothetical protein